MKDSKLRARIKRRPESDGGVALRFQGGWVSLREGRGRNASQFKLEPPPVCALSWDVGTCHY